jgi:hypothetical protein
MTKSYSLVFFEENYNITNYKYCANSDDIYNKIMYSIRAGDEFIIKQPENVMFLDNKLSNYFIFTPDILKSGFYNLENIKTYLDKEKVKHNYPTNFIQFLDIMENNYGDLSNLIFLEYIYDKMLKNNYKIVHIIYE